MKTLTVPFPYQARGVRRMTKFGGRALLADEMGLGKSLQALRFYLENKAICSPCVVICPASLKYNWERECMKHIGVRAEVCEGRSLTVPKLKLKHRVLIINYDILSAWLPYLLELDPQLIILDECHYIKNRGAQRTKNVRKLCYYCPHIIAISGTPLTNRPSELWPVLNVLLPDHYKSFMSFAWKYCKPRRKPWGWEFKGATNLKELHTELRSVCMIRRLKSQVLKDLPSKIRCVVRLPIEDRKQYKMAEKDFVRWLAKNKPTKANKAARAQALVRVGYLRRLAAELKMKSVLTWVQDFFSASEGKLVVMGVHKSILKQIKEAYPKNKSVLVNGEVVGRKRQEAVDIFQTKPLTRLFIGNIAAAGVGLNLTAASCMAFCELPWTPAELNQGEDRLHRIGQTSSVTCYYLIAEGTIEEDQCKILQKKQQVLESVLDGGQSLQVDIFTQLLQNFTERNDAE